MLSAVVIDPWAAADPVWRPCFELAWEAFQAGSAGVGAVLVDGGGAIVGAGRNRRNEQAGVPGQLGGSNIAHAELNALAVLPIAEYDDHVLYTTLEPCLLCTAALRMSHVGTVRFAAEDPLWHGIDQIPELNHNLARRWTRREGPLTGPLHMWAAALPVVSSVERGIAVVIEGYRKARPDVLELAGKLASRAEAFRRMYLDEALETVWADLTS
jgi:tRNA(Arg) A34 adenosine deaminase TadA